MRLLFAILLLIPFLAHSDTTNYYCKYTSYSDEKGNHKISKTLELKFIVDKESGKSFMLRINGISEVITFGENDQIAFVEITATENIISTAIDSNLNSVHSRNSVLHGKLLASQFYGKCEIK